MPKNNHVQFKWASAPSHEQLLKVIDGQNTMTPRPTIKINLSAKDIPHASLEALLAFAGEHGIDMGMTLTSVYEEGRQLVFWNTAQDRLPV